MKKGKFSLFFCLILVIMVLTTLAACATTTTTTAPAPPPVTTTATATGTTATTTATTTQITTTTQVVETVTLRVSVHTPEPANISKAFKEWAERIEQQSNGQLIVKVFYSSSLVPTTEMVRGMQTGMTDLAFYNIGTNAGLLPLLELARLPFIGLPSMAAGQKIMKQLIAETPALQEEIAKQGIKLLSLHTFPPEQMFTTKKQVILPSDLKGMKIIARGYWPQVLEGTGVACLNLGIEDWYTSLERGLAEGHIINFLSTEAFKTIELLKYHTILGDGGASMVTGGVWISAEVFDSLPANLQKVLLDNAAWFEPKQLEVDGGDETGGLERAKANNHTFHYATTEEIMQWSDLAKPLHEQYMTDNAGAGPIREIYDRLQELIAENQ